MGLLDRLDSIVRPWMLQAPRQHWARLMGGFAPLLDGMSEGVYEGRLAAMPGQNQVPNIGGNVYENFDALPLIGRDRSLVQGLSETPFQYAARLRAWLDAWSGAGTPFALLTYVAALLQPDPGIVRIVTSGGDWWTLDGTVFTWQRGSLGWSYDFAAGTLSTPGGTAHAWDWDSATLPPPPRQGWARFWIVCYLPNTDPYCDADEGAYQDPGLFSDTWNNPISSGNDGLPDEGVTGLTTPAKWCAALRNAVEAFRMAGIPCERIIVSLDPAAFNPTGDSTPTSIPDGQWGWPSKPATGPHRVWSRYPGARYVTCSYAKDL